MKQQFTGWHMTGILLAFFGVVVAVNAVMATNAIRTFGGVVVENSYVASQKFDGWLAAAREQQRLGWNARATIADQRHLIVTLAGPEPATIRVHADHPLGLEPSRTFTMRALGGGRYRSDAPLGSGRWMLRIEVEADGRTARFEDEVRA